MEKLRNFKEFWETKVKPVAMEVMNKSAYDSPNVHHYVGKMIWMTDYDIEHGSLNLSLYDIESVRIVLSDEEYYKEIHKNSSSEEISRMKTLATLLNELQKYIYLEGDQDNQS